MSFPRYPEYKDSGVEWLGKVPAHWVVVPARRIFDNVREAAEPESEQLAATQSHGVIPQKDFIEQRNQKVVLALAGTGNFKKVQRNDFVISLRSFQGGIEHSAFDGCVSPAYTVLRPSSTKSVSPPFYKFLLKAREFIDALQAVTTGIREGRTITYDQFASIPLPIAPTDEQHSIATFLDHETARIDALVEEQQRLIELLKEKRQAVISHAVTKGLDPDVLMKDSGVEWLGEVPAHWDVVPLGLLARKIQTGPFGSQLHSHEYIDGGVPVINPSSIINGEIVPDQSCTVTQDVVERMAHQKLSAGELVVGRRGEMGRCAVVSSRQEGWLCGTGSLRISLNERAAPEFVAMFIRTPLIRGLLQIESVGSTMDNLNPEILSRIRIPVPPIEEQQDLVESIDLSVANTQRLTSVRLKIE